MKDVAHNDWSSVTLGVGFASANNFATSDEQSTASFSGPAVADRGAPGKCSAATSSIIAIIKDLSWVQARLVSLDPAGCIEDDIVAGSSSLEVSVVWIVITDDRSVAVVVGVATAVIEVNGTGGSISDHVEVKLLCAHAPK